MTGIDLPPLPKASDILVPQRTPVYNVDLMREYARQAVAVALEEAARICDDKHHNWRFGDGDDSTSGPKECAHAIRALNQQRGDK